MTNLFQELIDLLPKTPLLVGTVAAVHSDGTATVTLLGGGQVRVRGNRTVGTQVFVKDGVIDTDAPVLPYAVIEV